ncbi:hypothetical protein [Mucilaginibacter arboris]|uniref:Uncharacterized protein n=1 Tax=Mucilaginibacter arboris TaxID=2682090 RepID=A0A7K1SUR5_9SPHI|nr:hypothetical protein [Mucilaginibacter arboris]MVN21065.1 hypothetical protein [Mucilaginibacter arboris]
MKKNTTSINKMIKNFDKELRNLLLTDLKVARVASKALVKNINPLDNNQLMIA